MLSRISRVGWQRAAVSAVRACYPQTQLATPPKQAHKHKTERDANTALYLLGASVFGASALALMDDTKAEKKFTVAEVEEHMSLENGVWIIHGNRVYDVTSFVALHPGGTKILLAAGKELAPFWELYNVHKSEEVQEMLEEMCIGELAPGEMEKRQIVDLSDPFALEPLRNKELIPSSQRPFNAEPPINYLVESRLTPNDLFFTRNHLAVPSVDISTYQLEVSGVGLSRSGLTFKLDDIKQFPKYTVEATLQCAGNRRSELTDVKPVKGLRWGIGAISNATWSGARLLDVLKAAGLDGEAALEAGAQHVQFEGLDRDESNWYGASIPLETALNPLSDIILAYEMNSTELPADHGYPLRVIIPGTVGARNVKWLTKISLSNEESRSHWQRNDYKGFNVSVDWHNVNFESAQSIQELPVTSAICVPEHEGTVQPDQDGFVTIKGYAWSGGGRGIIRVDVSLDGGKEWVVANMRRPEQPWNRTWAWTQWELKVPFQNLVRGEDNKAHIVCKAVDSSYNSQPEEAASIWNMRGLLSNSWHRVSIKVDDRLASTS